jgi:hypothetical protein
MSPSRCKQAEIQSIVSGDGSGKGTCAEQRTIKAYRGNGGAIDLHAFWTALTEVFRDFPQLQGECQGIMRKGARPASPSRRLSAEVIPPPQVAEAFSQDDPNTSGFNSQENHPSKILV